MILWNFLMKLMILFYSKYKIFILQNFQYFLISIKHRMIRLDYNLILIFNRESNIPLIMMICNKLSYTQSKFKNSYYKYFQYF